MGAEGSTTWPRAKGRWQPPEVRRGRERIPFQSLPRQQITLIWGSGALGLLASTTVTEYTSVILSQLSCDNVLQQLPEMGPVSTLGSAFLAWSTARLAGGRPCAHMTHDSSEPEGKPLGIPPLEAQKLEAVCHFYTDVSLV